MIEAAIYDITQDYLYSFEIFDEEREALKWLVDEVNRLQRANATIYVKIIYGENK